MRAPVTSLIVLSLLGVNLSCKRNKDNGSKALNEPDQGEPNAEETFFANCQPADSDYALRVKIRKGTGEGHARGENYGEVGALYAKIPQLSSGDSAFPLIHNKTLTNDIRYNAEIDGKDFLFTISRWLMDTEKNSFEIKIDRVDGSVPRVKVRCYSRLPQNRHLAGYFRPLSEPVVEPDLAQPATELILALKLDHVDGLLTGRHNLYIGDVPKKIHFVYPEQQNTPEYENADGYGGISCSKKSLSKKKFVLEAKMRSGVDFESGFCSKLVGDAQLMAWFDPEFLASDSDTSEPNFAGTTGGNPYKPWAQHYYMQRPALRLNSTNHYRNVRLVSGDCTFTGGDHPKAILVSGESCHFQYDYFEYTGGRVGTPTRDVVRDIYLHKY